MGMTDLEKVIKGLEETADDLAAWERVVYSGDRGQITTMKNRVQDAIDLLGAQSCEDAVSREAAIAAVWDFMLSIGKGKKPYTAGELLQVARDVIQALPSIQPTPIAKVLTFDEIIATQPGNVVWLEDIDKDKIIAGLVIRSYIYSKMIKFQVVGRVVECDFDDYDIRWRCWTAKPTEEQRKAVKWE